VDFASKINQGSTISDAMNELESLIKILPTCTQFDLEFGRCIIGQLSYNDRE
jgi:hypothetical protein